MDKKDKIFVFYHLYQCDGWETLFQQQMYSLIISGLYEKIDSFYVCVNGNQSLTFHLDKFIVVYNNDLSSEKDTILKAWELSSILPNFKLFYFHTKSVSYFWNLQAKANADAWRIYMEHYLIFNWQKCVKLLSDYDCVGTEFISPEKCVWFGENGVEFTLKFKNCFSGNFWWTNSKYFKTLDPDFFNHLNVTFDETLVDKVTNQDILKLKRFNSETFLFQKEPSFYNFQTICEGPQEFYEKNCFFKLINNIEQKKVLNYAS